MPCNMHRRGGKNCSMNFDRSANTRFRKRASKSPKKICIRRGGAVWEEGTKKRFLHASSSSSTLRRKRRGNCLKNISKNRSFLMCMWEARGEWGPRAKKMHLQALLDPLTLNMPNKRAGPPPFSFRSGEHTYVYTHARKREKKSFKYAR